MKLISVLFIFIISLCTAYALPRDSTRKELLNLLNERKQMFESYSQSIKQKSGFFGNRTKNDLKESQFHLKEIITLDNKIMNSLYRTIDFREFEKTSLTFDASEYQDRINNLVKMNDVLNKKNEEFEKQNNYFLKTVLKFKFYFIVLLVVIITLMVMLFRKRVS